MTTLKYLVCLFIIVPVCAACIAQDDSIDHRVILVGDAGQLDNEKSPVLELIRAAYDLNHSPSSVIFLGDNVYPHGLPDEESANYQEKRNILQLQADVV